MHVLYLIGQLHSSLPSAHVSARMPLASSLIPHVVYLLGNQVNSQLDKDVNWLRVLTAKQVRAMHTYVSSLFEEE
jgi:hypothetical protein